MSNNLRLKEQVKQAHINTNLKQVLLDNLEKMQDRDINVLLVGATGTGKSTTINALLKDVIAKVGYGVDPETMSIHKYQKENWVFWDSPGLGDSPERDMIFSQLILDKLCQIENGCFVIDLVMIIIDGSGRDMSTVYNIFENIILPNIESNRIIIAVNQYDMMLKGEGWNYESRQPEAILKERMFDKIQSVSKRIEEFCKESYKPIGYSAYHNYMIDYLWNRIILYSSKPKRIAGKRLDISSISDIYIKTTNADIQLVKSNKDHFIELFKDRHTPLENSDVQIKNTSYQLVVETNVNRTQITPLQKNINIFGSFINIDSDSNSYSLSDSIDELIVKIPINFNGKITIETQSGDCDICDEFRHLNVKTMSGGIDVTIKKSLKNSNWVFKTMSGDIDVSVEQLKGSGNWVFKTMSGDIDMLLESRIPINYSVSTMSGDIDNDLIYVNNSNYNLVTKTMSGDMCLEYFS